MDYSYKNYFEEFENIFEKSKLAKNNASNYRIKNHIGKELTFVCDDIKEIIKLLTNETDENIVSLVNNINKYQSNLNNILDFINIDYVNAEVVYIRLYNELENLKDLTETLKTLCDYRESDFKVKKLDDDGNTVLVLDKNKYNNHLKKILTLKSDCEKVVERIHEYIKYLESIKNSNPIEGSTGLKIPNTVLKLDYNDVASGLTSGVLGNLFDNFIEEIEPVQEASSIESIKPMTVRYADTDVWYAIIPKELQPKLAVGTNSNGERVDKAPSKLAQENGAKIAINFSLTGVGYTKDKKKEYMGGGAGLIYDGKNLYKLKNNYHDTTLYMDKNGKLGYFYNDPKKNDGMTPEEKIEELQPKWAAKTFYPIAVDGQYVDENKDPNIGGKSVNPRTFIGQTNDGDYFVGVCTGRNINGKQKGLTLKEVYDFSQEVTGGNIKFLMNGDGGGSSAFVYDGEKQNPDTHKAERARPDIIYWA